MRKGDRMLEAYIEGNELVSSGEVKVDDNYFGFCCNGFKWEVALISPLLIWGVCWNLECPVDETRGGQVKNGMYHGVSAIDQEELELWLAEIQEDERK